MGACLAKGGDDCSVGPGQREPSRKRSRSVFGPSSSRSGVDRGSSVHRPPVPDFGVGSVYRVMELLGEGGTGQTWMCQDLKTHRRVAIKFIPRPLAKVLVPMVSQEIQLQTQLSEGHLGLVRVESALLSKSHLGLVMEYVDGGTLTQYVIKRTSNKGERGGLHLTEDEARYFFRQLIAAVEYLHASHVAHRDLKMCNVVLTQRRPPTLKLCDFGFAKGWDESSMMATRLGTPVYMSPQLIESKNDGKTYSATAADVWACGVMLFAMLLGRFPYDHVGHTNPNSSGAHLEVLDEQLKASKGDWRSAPRVAPHINLLSEECKDLLGKMLMMDERQRITIPDIRKHVWFTTELPPYLNEALQDFEEQQARLAKVMEAATHAQIKRRNKAVHDLILMAGPPDTAAERKLSDGGRHPLSHGGSISAIFEVGTEAEVASTNGGSFGTSRTRTMSPIMSPTASPEKGQDEAPASGFAVGGGGGGGGGGKGGQQQQQQQQALMICGSSREGGTPERAASSLADSEVIVVDLAAVASRTKSGGLVLMSTYFPDGDEGDEIVEVGKGIESSRNCDSDESDPAVENRCGRPSNRIGDAFFGYNASIACTADAAGGGAAAGGGDESVKAASDDRTAPLACELAHGETDGDGTAAAADKSVVVVQAVAAIKAAATAAAAAAVGFAEGVAVASESAVHHDQVVPDVLEPAAETVETAEVTAA